ncbi:MAG: 1-acyl-sn-glycerol-3-phosphate acyltransferase, partial [Bacteroidales bacterium]|nr:1-acyl-sn-glycerol-3-phosphate acyltransferase [Bacteroidales bacterium]
MLLPILVGCAGLVGLYVIAAWFLPGWIRPFLGVIARIGYRFHVHGRERIPTTGPALIVCNHVSYLDWLFLWVGSPRPLTFVIWSGFDRNPLIRLALSFARTRLIRIDNQSGRPHATRDALQRVTAAMDE